MATANPTCPRCGAEMASPTAMYWLCETSRYDGVTDICPACSSDEAFIAQSQGQQAYRVPLGLLHPVTGLVVWKRPPR